MIRRLAIISIFSAAVTLSGGATAGTVQVVNDSGTEVRVKCSYVQSFHMHSGERRDINYNSSVRNVTCNAHDLHNNHMGGQRFHLEDHDSWFMWRVGHH